MRRIVLSILVIAASLALFAGDYHIPGGKLWATGSTEIVVETPAPLKNIRVMSFTTDCAIILLPPQDDARTALGDTIPVLVNRLTPVAPNGSKGFKIIRTGTIADGLILGSTDVWAVWD